MQLETMVAYDSASSPEKTNPAFSIKELSKTFYDLIGKKKIINKLKEDLNLNFKIKDQIENSHQFLKKYQDKLSKDEQLNKFLTLNKNLDIVQKLKKLLGNDLISQNKRKISLDYPPTHSKSRKRKTRDDSDSDYSATEDDNNLVHAEKAKNKFNVRELLAYGNDPELLSKLALYAQIEFEAHIDNIHNSSNKNKENNTQVYILAEYSHKEEHQNNVNNLKEAIKNEIITDDLVICIERKEKGENYGMSDIILLSTIIDYNRNPNTAKKITIKEEIKSSSLYADAILYNSAKQKGITVTAIEGKDKASDQEREEYITIKIEQIAASGKNVILVIGRNHAKNIKSDLDNKSIPAEIKTSAQELLEDVKQEQGKQNPKHTWPFTLKNRSEDSRSR